MLIFLSEKGKRLSGFLRTRSRRWLIFLGRFLGDVVQGLVFWIGEDHDGNATITHAAVFGIVRLHRPVLSIAYGRQPRRPYSADDKQPNHAAGAHC